MKSAQFLMLTFCLFALLLVSSLEIKMKVKKQWQDQQLKYGVDLEEEFWDNWRDFYMRDMNMLCGYDDDLMEKIHKRFPKIPYWVNRRWGGLICVGSAD